MKVADAPRPLETDAAQAARDDIDRQIRELELAIAVLKDRRNTLAPTFRFPPEVLSRVFIEWRNKSLSEPVGVWTQFGRRRSDASWVTASYVCRQWRATALACRPLWGWITSSTGLKWMQVMLDRSQSALLSVELQFNFVSIHRRDTVMALLIPHLPRVQEIVLHFDVPNDQFGPFYMGGTSFHWLSGDSLPQLRHLHVAGSENTRDTLDPQLLATYTKNVLPRIQIASFIGFLPWAAHAHFLTSIVELHVEILGSQKGSLDEMFTALQNMPRIEKLSLRDAIPTDGWKQEQPSIVMSHLTHLTVDRSRATPLLCLLRHISMPKLTDLSIEVREDEAPLSKSSLRALSGYVNLFWGQTSDRGMVLDTLSIFRIANRAAVAMRADHSSGPASRASLTLVFDVLTPGNGVIVRGGLPLDGITNLHTKDVLFPDILPNLCGVHRLRIDGSATAIVQHLSRLEVESDDSLLPCLEDLDIDILDLKLLWACGLEKWLTSRLRRCARLRRLHIYARLRNGSRQEWEQLLRQHASEVFLDLGEP